MRLHRRAPFLHAYRFLPHRLLNRAAAALTAAERPRFLVDAAIRFWIDRDRIDVTEYLDGWRSLDEFFLRRLRPGARPLGPALVSPADGIVVDAGAIDPDRRL